MYPPGSADFWVCLVSAALLLSATGLVAGLTIGFVGISDVELEILKRTGNARDVARATRVQPLLKHHHLVLVTLVLCNAAANEALPIVLQSIVPPWLALALSVTLVLVAGEIIPSAVFSGPRQLQLASFLTPLLYFLMFVCFGIAAPIAALLDRCIGESRGKTLSHPWSGSKQGQSPRLVITVARSSQLAARSSRS